MSDAAYSDKIQTDALEKGYGFKAANLINLGVVIEEFERSSKGKEAKKLYRDLAVTVPSFRPLSSDIIAEHLNKHAPEWKKQFAEFQKNFDPEKDTTLSKEQKELLEKTQQIIIDCFRDHPIAEELLNKILAAEKIRPNAMVMVRSTGIHEDKADMANPGGNESLPSRLNIKEISAALGRVAASYIGEKSLSQRLNSGDKDIAKLPVMPVLAQSMIGEGINGNDSTVYSGVIYTNGSSTRMQAAPGHGEYVVNSKGKVDNYYISSQDVLYKEIQPKDFRLQPQVSFEGTKVSLERVENSAELKYQSSLPENVALYLHEFSKFLEEKYSKRMDIEFVYDPENKQINIVQARAIPEASRRGLEPSTLSPDFLGKNKNLIKVEGLQVITPEVNRAAVITDSKQVIITNTIEEALSRYNTLGQQAGIRAVIVQNPSPDTSHEAGVFNAYGIAVMQVKDIEPVEKLLSEAQPIIVDPQHSKIYQIPNKLFEVKSKDNIEQDLFEQKILEKGIFASALSGYVTTTKYNLSPVRKETRISSEDALIDKTVGTLVAESQTGSVKSTKELLDLAYKARSFGEEKKIEKDPASNDKARDLRQNLVTLATPKIGDKNDNKDLRAALGFILRATEKAYEKKYISQDLFKQAIISGAELSVLLDKMGKQTSEPEQDKIYLEYFNVQKKFQGLIFGSGDSLANSLKARQYEELAETLAPSVKGASKIYLTESLKLGDYLISDKAKEEWNKFCASACATDEGAKRLGKLINQVVSFGAHEQWINFIFMDQFNYVDNPNSADKEWPKIPAVKVSHEIMLKTLEDDFANANLKPINEASKLIKSMETQIPLWRDPNKFTKLRQELQNNLKVLDERLKWKPEASNLEKILMLEQVNQLVDVMDKSIKSLTRSPEYGDTKDAKGNDLQTARFRDILKDFHGVMETWVTNAGVSNDNKLLNLLNQFLANTIKEQQKGVLTKQHLNPSSNFFVDAATFNKKDTISGPKTLEDAFTLIHQNTIIAIAQLAKGNSEIINIQLPDLVKKLNQKLVNELKGDDGVQITPSSTIKLQNRHLQIAINAPLRNHSAQLNVKYDKTKNLSVKFSIFGPPDNFDRWDHIMLDSYLHLTQKNVEFIQKPYYDKEKRILNFEINIKNEEQIDCFIEAVNQSIKTSYELSVEKTETADEYYLQLLKKRDELLSDLTKKNPDFYFIKSLPGSLYSWLELNEMNKQGGNVKAAEFLSSNIPKVSPLLSKGFTPEMLIEMHSKDAKLTELIIDKSKEISSFLEKKELTPQDISQVYVDQIDKLLKGEVTAELLKASLQIKGYIAEPNAGNSANSTPGRSSVYHSRNK